MVIVGYGEKVGDNGAGGGISTCALPLQKNRADEIAFYFDAVESAPYPRQRFG